MPYIPPFEIPYMPTQSVCESTRQTVLSISASQPMYDSHNNYIGDCRVYYECTPCTGSDIGEPTGGSEFGIADVKADALLQGEAFFSPHETRGLENWMNDYLVRLNAMGPAILDLGSYDISSIPLTGDVFVDRFYLQQSLAFMKAPAEYAQPVANKTPEPPPPAPAPETGNSITPPETAGEGIGTTVQLLTSREEQAKRDEWMKMNGFANPVVIGASNTIDPSGTDEPVMSFKEAALREYVGGDIAGSFALKTLDGATAGMTEGLSMLISNDNAGAAELGNSLMGGSVAKNAFLETAEESATDAVTGFVTKPILGMVKGAETVTGFITTGKSIWDTMYGK